MNRPAPLLLALVLGCGAPRSEPGWVPPVAPTAPFAALDLPAVAWSWSAGTARTDWITRVIPTRNGDFVAVGFLDRDDGAASDWDAVAVRFTADGTIRWLRRFGGSGVDAFWDVVETGDGDLVAAGFSSTGSAGANDAWVARLDGAGRLRAERRIGGARDDLALGLATAPDGDFLLVGQTASQGAGERDVLLVRLGPDLVERWRRTSGGPGVDRGFFGARVDGGFVVAGVTGVDGNYDILTMKVGEDGTERWRSVVGAEGNDPNHGLAVLPDGRILVAGYSASWGSAVHDLVALTYAPDGTLLRHELLGGPGDDRVMSAIPAPGGGAWLVGYTRSGTAGGWDVMVARIDAEGGFEPWLAAVGGPRDDQAYAGTLTRDGDLLIGGYSDQPAAGAPPDLLLARLATDRLTRRRDGVTLRRLR